MKLVVRSFVSGGISVVVIPAPIRKLSNLTVSKHYVMYADRDRDVIVLYTLPHRKGSIPTDLENVTLVKPFKFADGVVVAIPKKILRYMDLPARMEYEVEYVKGEDVIVYRPRRSSRHYQIYLQEKGLHGEP